VGAVVTALTTFVALLQAPHTDVNDLGVVDWLVVVVSAIVAGLSVYAVPNQPKNP
jgi:hypothetical protein